MTEQEALTLTIWGEARGEPIEGKIGVANVMRNRLLTKYRGATSYVEVCTARAQFSAWTEEAKQMQDEAEVLTGDPQMKNHPDPVLRLCWEIARATINNLLADNTRGATHYYATSISAPIWAQGQPLLASLGAHRFFHVA
jgi:spore germination cell wall hydrolase CwlJ-like protein